MGGRGGFGGQGHYNPAFFGGGGMDAGVIGEGAPRKRHRMDDSG